MTDAVEKIAPEFDTQRRREYVLTDDEEALEGLTALGDPTTGQVLVGASPASGKLFLGVFDDHLTGDGTSKITVDHMREITVLYRENDGSITASDIFNKCYVVDNQTVGKTSTNRALAGTILVVDDVLGVGFAVGSPFLENT